MAAIESATLTAFYLFDVADDIDVAALRATIGGSAASARLVPKSTAPSYLSGTPHRRLLSTAKRSASAISTAFERA